jgi:hypothetical protein
VKPRELERRADSARQEGDAFKAEAMRVREANPGLAASLFGKASVSYAKESRLCAEASQEYMARAVRWGCVAVVFAAVSALIGLLS